MNLFDYALEFTLQHEGGYVNDPADPGGETIYGISRRAHPEPWAGGRPTKATAALIYRRDYWDACRCDELPAPVAVVVFDTAVNCGCRRAVQFLQRAIGTKDDGVIGPITIAKAKALDAGVTARLIADYRLAYYRGLATFPRFGKGWTNRTTALVGHVSQLDGVA